MVLGSLIGVLVVGVLGVAVMAMLTLPKDADISTHVGMKGFDGHESRNFAVGIFVGIACLCVALALVSEDARGGAAFVLVVTLVIELVAVLRAMVENVNR